MMNKLGKLKMLTLLSLFLLFGVWDAFGQEQLVTINVKNASLDEVFKVIEKQTTYRFSYRNVVIDGKKDISISQTNASVPAVLKKHCTEGIWSLVLFHQNQSLSRTNVPIHQCLLLIRKELRV